MEDKSNKVLIVAIVCVIVGVVVGSVLMNGNMIGSQAGQALDSDYADVALRNQVECEPPMVSDTDGNCVLPTTPDRASSTTIVSGDGNPNDYLYGCTYTPPGSYGYQTNSSGGSGYSYTFDGVEVACTLIVARTQHTKLDSLISPILPGFVRSKNSSGGGGLNHKQYNCGGSVIDITFNDGSSPSSFNLTIYYVNDGSTTWNCNAV
jgi:hypothetical protein